MVRVSIVITSYNSGPLLERAVRSVLDQTMPDFEIIIVDDGSDSPQAWIDRLDERIRFHSQPNRGVSIARNVGASLATADLVAFLDHDDEWLPEKLAIQLQAVTEHPTAAFWITGFDWVKPGGVTPAPGTPINYRGMLRGTMIDSSTLIVRRADFFAVGGYNPLLSHVEDGDLYLRLTLHGREPIVVPDRLARYNVQDGGASSDYRAIAAANLALLKAHEHRARRRSDSETLAAIRAGRRNGRSLYAHQAIASLRRRGKSEWRDAIGDFVFALRSGPWIALRAVGKALWSRIGRVTASQQGHRRLSGRRVHRG